jgi:alkylhydroperoxidase/carboxymuconolactone decarboxylase family protein YurZ
MSENPLKVLEKIDPKLMSHIDGTRDLAFAEGVLPSKFKFLVAMALDAAEGSETGVKSLAHRAIQEGATKQEIGEVLRIVKYVCGAGSMYTAARGLKEII